MSTLLRSFYHNLKEPIIIYDTKEGSFYQNKACKSIFGEIKTKANIHALKKIGYKFHFDFCLLNSDDIALTPFDEAINSKSSFTTYGVYQQSETKLLYFSIKAFSIKKYRIIYFYDLTKDLECEKIVEENERLKIQNKEFLNTNSKAQNQAVKMALLNRISTSLSKTLDLNTMIDTALKDLSIILGENKLYFARRIKENEFEIQSVYPSNIENKETLFYKNETLSCLTDGKSSIGRVLKEHDKSKTPINSLLTRIIMPVTKQADLIGIIVIFTSKKNITELEKELLVSISMQISNAFLGASLFREVNRQKEELQKALTELKETQLQLINSEKMASLGQLIASVAHEINTPIASISANNEILSKLSSNIKKTIDSDLMETLDDIITIDFEAIKRITNLVQSLKRFVRLDETVVQKADINKELDLTLEILRHKTKKGIETVKNYGEIHDIECYPNMLNQVFLNILMNAIQSIEKEKAAHTSAQSVLKTKTAAALPAAAPGDRPPVSAQPFEYKGRIEILTKQENSNLIIKITDNGAGIDENSKKRIFQAGFTTKKVGEGTGLGLAICKKIVEKHKGKITFDSKVLKGKEKTTWFKIVIPYKK